MNMSTSEEILSTAGRSASEITHYVKEVGGGSLSNGLQTIWNDGYSAGKEDLAVAVIKAGVYTATVLLITGFCSGYAWYRKKREEHKKAIQAAYLDGLEAAKGEDPLYPDDSVKEVIAGDLAQDQKKSN